jgi:hypothetical protein
VLSDRGAATRDGRHSELVDEGGQVLGMQRLIGTPSSWTRAARCSGCNG